ncbi:MAG: hypothetical protein IJ438_05270 [Clostridia bacterium]|nr:hypothetical protein [Clostridia bacterium]
MSNVYTRFMELKEDFSLISLERIENIYPYFCYPTNAKAIGFEGCIMYCFIEGYGNMVFASNPETCADTNVYPLASTFEDFLRLILACGSANPVEQIVWMSKERFEQHLSDENAASTPEKQEILRLLRTELDLIPMENPYEYVRAVQSDFDGSKIQYSDEYYDVLGIERN